jgi:uncharacterized protein (TIGR03118 family)
MNIRSVTALLASTTLALGFAFGTAQAKQDFYQQRNLVSDGAVAAEHVDPNLVNPWGIAFNPNGFDWIANEATGTSTLYDGDGNANALVVQIPTPASDTGGNPTGIVFNGTSGFVVGKGDLSGPSRFLFATQDGVIAGWAPNVDLTHAIVAVDNSMSTGAIYTGLALSTSGPGARLYAADFFNARVDVFDASFAAASLPAGAFTDPNLPAGYSPFGIQAIGDTIYVAYAKQSDERDEEEAGHGLGIVDTYDANGTLLRRFVSHGQLNAPWGMALAPAGFGRFSNAILIGNFGDGRINAYDQVSGERLGALKGADNEPIEIEGLWGIAFGNGRLNQPRNTLFFAAGINDEANGLYGRIDASAR